MGVPVVSNTNESSLLSVVDKQDVLIGADQGLSNGLHTKYCY